MLFSKPKENKTEDGKMFDMRKIGKRIAELRKSKNITQMALADMMGISFQAVSNWERGESMPDISKLGELSEIFGVSIDDILCNKRAAEISMPLLPLIGNIGTGKVIPQKTLKVIFFLKEIFGIFTVGKEIIP